MPGFWRKCRITFRWARLCVWLLVLAAIGAFLWCNRVGLPDFLKARVVATLRERGVGLEFSRMRLSLVRGIVAENVRAGTGPTAGGAALAARTVQLHMDFPALWHGRLQLDGLVLRDGVFSLVLRTTNALVLTNLQADLRFGAGDTWSLDQFSAGLAGAQIGINGELAHATEARNWRLFRGTGTDGGALADALGNFCDVLGQIHYQGTPRLRLTLTGDARNLASIAARVEATADGVRAPWFAARDFQAIASLNASTNVPSTGDANLGFWTNLQPFRVAWSLRLGVLRSAQLDADAVACAGLWSTPVLAVTNLSARLGGGQISASAALDVPARWLAFTNDSSVDPHALAMLLPDNMRGQLTKVSWKTPPLLRLEGALQFPPWNNFATNWPADLASTARLRGEVTFTNAAVAGVAVDRLRGNFSYTNLIWDVTNLRLAQERTQLLLAGGLDEATGNYHFLASGEVDAAGVRPFLPTFLPTNVANGFSALAASGPLVLALDVAGNLHTLGGMSVTGRVAQARTELQLGGQLEKDAGNFIAHVSGQFDLASIKPFLTTNAANGFSILTTTVPLVLALDAAGNLHALAELTATGRVALANFAVREQTVDAVAGRVAFADRVLHFIQPELRRENGAQAATADEVALDFKTMVLSFTNGFSTLAPTALTRAIGPMTAHWVEPYQFLQPPVARVNGHLPLRNVASPHDTAGTDLRFDILQYVPFQWLKLHSTGLMGTIRWLGPELVLTNITGDLYGGIGTGAAYFDFSVPHPGADYNFTLSVTNVDLHRFAQGMLSPTNHLEGTLAGLLVVTRANTEDLRSWDGYGTAHLHDGLLWDIPIFGIISPVLNTFSAGLGNSRATEATARYLITNGIISSDSLEIRSTLMRLGYTGTVDMLQNVNAHVTARLLRDIPVVGPLIGLATWPLGKAFECRVTGKLGDPEVTPIYIPFSRLLLAPLHPIRSLEELFSPPNSTNAPPK